MSSQNPSAAVSHYLSLLPKEISAELTLETPRDIGRNYLLHISKNNRIKTFTPMVTRRSLTKENRSVVRVSTAPTILGCMLGYSSTLYDFYDASTANKETGKPKDVFLGGWIIYGIPFTTAFKPSKKLLPDADVTGERWLVTYDKATLTYPTKPLGKIFFTEVTHRAGNKTARIEVEAYVEVLSSASLLFNTRTCLDKGYWKITFADMHRSRTVDTVPVLSVQAVSEKQYLEAKRLVASFLSFESYPPSSRW